MSPAGREVGSNWEALWPCHCGLFHLPDNHAKPAAVFATPDRCASCVRLRCDRPEECAYPPVGARRVLEESR